MQQEENLNIFHSHVKKNQKKKNPPKNHHYRIKLQPTTDANAQWCLKE